MKIRRNAIPIILAASFVVSSLIRANEPEHALSTRLSSIVERYNNAYKAKDYITMVSYMLPAVVEEIGGTKEVVQLLRTATAQLEQQGFRITELKFDGPGPIISHEDVVMSVVPTTTPVSIQGEEGELHSSILAFSADGGATWYFIEGSDEGRMHIADVAPSILQHLPIPPPTLVLGSGEDRIVLVQQSGEWVEQ